MNKFLLLGILLTLGACESLYREDVIYGDEDSVPTVFASVETTPVASLDDAADDPAIWYNHADPARSLIFGTDKQSGIGVYTLDGQLKQFIPAGLPNNIDLRQNISVGSWRGDLAAASNRDGDVVTLFKINADGGKIIGNFPAGLEEPYGSCMGVIDSKIIVFVTYKTGEVEAHQLQNINAGGVSQQLLATIPLATQLEGCVYDENSGVLFIGEEGRGLWRSTLTAAGDQLIYSTPELIDEVETASGLKADVEGVSLYLAAEERYIVVSSQGNDSYAIYELEGNHAFKGRFRVANNPASGIDGSQETDGLAADARSFGPTFPQGILVVQDGFNAPVGEAQNFKIIDWREIEKALNLK